MTFERFLWWTCVARIKKIRPFWYIQYSKEDAQSLLQERFNWLNYGGHHLENRITAFLHNIYAPIKFNTDFRSNTISALVRNGKLSREDGIALFDTKPKVERSLLPYVKRRLRLDDSEYERIMSEAPRSWQEFPTYKQLFEFLGPLFFYLAKRNLVPMSFYLKYCKRNLSQ